MKRTILLLTGVLSVSAINAQWSLTGNAGTTPGTNFVGTTDAKALQFKVNGQLSGVLDFATGKANTSFGFQAFNNLTGSNNSAFGYKSLFSNTNGKYNATLGAYTLYSNTSGFSNVAIGIGTMYRNQVQHNVVAIGDSALYNMTGTNIYSFGNVAVGSKALYSNTDGGSNTALGTFCLLTNTTGDYNTAAGYNTLRLNTTGDGNTGYGLQALIFNTTGSYNTAGGYDALFSNTTASYNTAWGSSALYNNTVANYNTAVGFEALYSNTGSGAAENTAVGWVALRNNVSGYYNTAVGGEALQQSTSSNNTAVGQYALHAATTAYGCTALGSFADVNFNNLQNSTAIGFSTYVDASNKVRIGATSVTSIGGQVGWTNFSDGRIKKNIKENVPGLRFINLLRPVTYNFDLDKEDELVGKKAKEDWAGRKDIEKINFTGFVAQDVEAAAKKISYEFSGLDKTGKIMGLRYSEFVVPLVKAVQELSASNDLKDEKITALEQKFADQQQQIEALKAMIISGNTAVVNTSATVAASLEQNAPNPFRQSTVIRYHLPASVSTAQMIITDNSGKTVKTINVAAAANGQVTLAAGSLSAGSYYYTLLADGKKLDSKKMEIVQ